MQAATHRLVMCRADFCQAGGCESVISHVEKRLGVKLGETSSDGWITLEAAYCLGLCGQAPAVMLDEALYGNVSAEVADALLDQMRRDADGA